MLVDDLKQRLNVLSDERLLVAERHLGAFVGTVEYLRPHGRHGEALAGGDLRVRQARELLEGHGLAYASLTGHADVDGVPAEPHPERVQGLFASTERGEQSVQVVDRAFDALEGVLVRLDPLELSEQ